MKLVKRPFIVQCYVDLLKSSEKNIYEKDTKIDDADYNYKIKNGEIIIENNLYCFPDIEIRNKIGRFHKYYLDIKPGIFNSLETKESAEILMDKETEIKIKIPLGRQIGTRDRFEKLFSLYGQTKLNLKKVDIMYRGLDNENYKQKKFFFTNLELEEDKKGDFFYYIRFFIEENKILNIIYNYKKILIKHSLFYREKILDELEYYE